MSFSRGPFDSFFSDPFDDFFDDPFFGYARRPQRSYDSRHNQQRLTHQDYDQRQANQGLGSQGQMTRYNDQDQQQMSRRRGGGYGNSFGSSAGWLDPFTSRSGWLNESRGGGIRMDMHEDNNAFKIDAEIPGIDKKDVKLDINDGMLTISGERKFQNKQEDPNTLAVRIERAYGNVSRTIALPKNIDESKICAKYDNGLLCVTLPKAQSSKQSQITIQ